MRKKRASRMTYLPSIVTLVSIWTLAVMSPGPDFAAIVRYATASSRQDGLFVAFGVTSALALWIFGSLTGVEILLTQVSWLFAILRLLGALYLLYLGISILLHAHLPALLPSETPSPQRSFSAWRVGFLTNISNPKAVAFFSSLFVVLLPAHPPLWVQILSGAFMLLIAASWFCLVACVFSLTPVTLLYQRAKRWIDLITGGIFTILGIGLLLNRW